MKTILKVLRKEKTQRVPFWLMRQAGRYLPEYRELRARKKGFMAMVEDSTAAAEVTMQPIRRFGMDAAIIFSDILVIPHALGQKLEFLEGEGPKLEPIGCSKDFSKLNYRDFESLIAPTCEALTRVKGELSSKGFSDTALIGFSGAPWTLAAYMIEGGGSDDFAAAKKFMRENPDDFSSLVDTLIESVSMYLTKQAGAGAEILQIFDSHAGLLNGGEFSQWVIRPTKEIIRRVRLEHPDIPVIGFPRGAGENYLSYVQQTGITAIGLDQNVSTEWAAKTLQPLMAVQGNLDPDLLLKGGDEMKASVEKILSYLSGGPHIFNLGHGVNKNTPVENVEALARTVREFSK